MGAAGICGAALSVLAVAHSVGGLEAWIRSQSIHSRNRLLESISRPDTKPGTVVAGTSKTNPPYYYHWVRDGALVFAPVVELYKTESDPNLRKLYRRLIEEFRALSRDQQLTNNPSGTITSGGLGEPKFEVDGSPYWLGWGRPQNDGPALRAITFIQFANLLLDQGEQALVRKTLYDGAAPTDTVIKSDLEYVSHEWQKPCHDIWEEARGQHFYTRLAQRRALVKGAALARRMGDHGAAQWYEQQATSLEIKIESHWDAQKGILRATLEAPEAWKKASDLDSAVFLASLHTADDDGYFGPSHPKILATAAKLIETFRSLYPINARTHDGQGNPLGVAIGRYPEDVYDGLDFKGGNPWVLITSAMAELIFKASAQWKKEEGIPLNPHTRSFFAALGLEVPSGNSLESDDPLFELFLKDLHAKADALINRIRFHAHPNGDLNEQMDKQTGHMRGAENLTWSYASFLTTMMAREKVLFLP